MSLLGTTLNKFIKLFVVIPLLSQYVHFRPYAQAKSKTTKILKRFLKQFTRKGIFNNFNYSFMHRNWHIQSLSVVTSEKSPCPGDQFFKISDSCTEILILMISNSNKFQGVGFFSPYYARRKCLQNKSKFVPVWAIIQNCNPDRITCSSVSLDVFL